jgi:hypothetical protein
LQTRQDLSLNRLSAKNAQDFSPRLSSALVLFVPAVELSPKPGLKFASHHSLSGNPDDLERADVTPVEHSEKRSPFAGRVGELSNQRTQHRI